MNEEKNELDKKELAREILKRVFFIKTCMEYSVIIRRQSNENIKTAFSPIFYALEDTIYIELYKLFDTGRDSQLQNVYALGFKRGSFKSYEKTITSIRNRRNKLYAHNLGKNGHVIYKENPCEPFEGLLKIIEDKCWETLNEKSYVYTNDSVKCFSSLINMINNNLTPQI